MTAATDEYIRSLRFSKRAWRKAVLKMPKFHIHSLACLSVAVIMLRTESYGIVFPDTLHLHEITITASRLPVVYSDISRIVTIVTAEEIKKIPAQNLPGILEHIISLDVRKRGAGTQADLNMRGGSFEQVLVMLNGIKVNDPQTGHHHLNIPVEISNIKRIEVLEGPGSRIFGPYAYAGAINIITGGEETEKLAISLSGGENTYFRGVLSCDFATGSVRNGISFGRRQSDGYRENTDFAINNIFYQGVSNIRKFRLEFQAGYLYKQFGANSFYTPLYPDQFEKIRSSLFSIKNTFGRARQLSLSISFRRHRDRFELFRYNPPDWYKGHNFHRTDVYGADFTYYIPWKLGTATAGVEFRTEKIVSNVLGEALSDTIWHGVDPGGFYHKGKDRQIISLFAEHAFYFDRLNASIGILGNYSQDFGLHFYPGVDISYALTDHMKIIGSWNQSLRLPSFTDLYYSGPTNIGNPKLIPEEAQQFETGIKYGSKILSGHVLFYYRDGQNIIDWVRIADSFKWESRNLTSLSTMGAEIKANLNARSLLGETFPIKLFTVAHSWVETNKYSGDYISYYALDYLRHKTSLSLHHALLNYLEFSWYINYQDRAGTYTSFPDGQEVPYTSFATVDMKVSYSGESYTLYAEASNLFNKVYVDFGNLPLSGRWIRAGITMHFFTNRPGIDR